jgi:hypothetical protein
MGRQSSHMVGGGIGLPWMSSSAARAHSAVHRALSDTPIRTVSRLLLLAGEAAVPSSRTRRSSWTVDVAQKAAAVVAATSVSRIAPSAVCVPRAVGAAGRLRGRRGGLSGRCEGHLVPVELQ